MVKNRTQIEKLSPQNRIHVLDFSLSTTFLNISQACYVIGRKRVKNKSFSEKAA